MTYSMKSLPLSVCSTQSALVDNLRKKCPLITLQLYINHGILYPILLQHTLHYDSGTVSEFQTYTFLLTLFSTPVHVMCLLTLAYLFCHF